MLEKVTVVGSGVMGEAFVKGLLGNGVLQPGQIVATDMLPQRRAQMQRDYDILVTDDNGEAVAGADVVVVAVKPQVARKVLDSINGRLERQQLVLSIAAGIPIATVVERLHHVSVVRAMPNTPGQIGQGATVWAATPQVTPLQREQTASILRALGCELYVEDERYLDMATALSGSGPAYVYLFYEAMVDAGVHIGFSRSQADELVFQTLVGSLAYLKHSGKHPAELRNAVTSPAGTTTDGLLEMEDSRLRAGIIRGVAAAYRRCIALGKSTS
ncbi:MAG: pyrroline-5-carboxylate reductase [Chloroflexota bacterium]